MSGETLRIGLISDSHGDHDALDRALAAMGKLSILCFMGDIAADAGYLQGRLALRRQDTLLYAVKGNNDLISQLPATLTFEAGGRRLLMTHGHMEGVKNDLFRLFYRAEQAGAHIALYGHTHVPQSGYERGIFLANPGACGGRHPACGVLTLAGGSLGYEAIVLG